MAPLALGQAWSGSQLPSRKHFHWAFPIHISTTKDLLYISLALLRKTRASFFSLHLAWNEVRARVIYCTAIQFQEHRSQWAMSTRALVRGLTDYSTVWRHFYLLFNGKINELRLNSKPRWRNRNRGKIVRFQFDLAQFHFGRAALNLHCISNLYIIVGSLNLPCRSTGVKNVQNLWPIPLSAFAWGWFGHRWELMLAIFAAHKLPSIVGHPSHLMLQAMGSTFRHFN